MLWAVVSTPVLKVMRSEGFGTYFRACISGETIRFVGYSFVDDTDLIQSARRSTETELEVASEMQRALNTWEGALRATGGAIVPSKSFWYLIGFQWAEGTWQYKDEHAAPAIQPSPGGDAEEEHTIVFYEKEHMATKTLHPMTVLSPHDEEQIIVFEMETIAPVCLFHLVPPSMASASVDGIASGGDVDALTPDAVQIVNVNADATAFGEDALLVPIPLDPRFVFHNTVEMLPPATGLLHQIVGIDCFDHECWPVCDPHSCHSFSDHGENLANLLSSLAIEDHSRELDYDGEILSRSLFLIADDDPVYDVSMAESFED
jgi:hypothetical protein